MPEMSGLRDMYASTSVVSGRRWRELMAALTYLRCGDASPMQHGDPYKYDLF